MISLVLRPFLLVLALAAPAATPDDETAKTFDLLYGNDLKRVLATKDVQACLELAAQLFEAAKASKTEPAMTALLCDKTYELALKDPKGFPLAIQAMELLAAKVPDRKDVCFEKIIAARQQQYAGAKGAGKTKAAEDLMLALDSAAKVKADAGDFEAAAALHRRALAIAATPDARNRLKAQLAELAGRQKIAKQVADLKAKVEANPGDAASRNELIRLYVVELDKPAEAAKFLNDAVDETTRKYLPATARPVAEAPELACLELGDWYMTLSDNASESAKPAMLARAAGYYKRFLELHKAEDASATKATLGLQKAVAALAKHPTSPSASTAETAGWNELLKLVALPRDFKGGPLEKYEVEADGLRLSGKDRVGLEIPVVPEGAYELRVKFTRRSVQGCVWVSLPVGPTTVGVLAMTRGGEFRAVDAGVPPFKPLVNISEVNRQYVMEYKVVPNANQTTIDVTLDGQPYTHWEGAWGRLARDPYWRVDVKAIGIGTYGNGDVTFHSVELRMITGKARALPTTPQQGAKKG